MTSRKPPATASGSSPSTATRSWTRWPAAAPGSTVYVRLATDGAGADWPLSHKFGCGPGEAAKLALRACHLGLPVGVSFHVGSQQRDPAAWDRPLAHVAELFDGLVAAGGTPAGVNLGGGLPSTYEATTPDVAVYGATITALVERHLARLRAAARAHRARSVPRR